MTALPPNPFSDYGSMEQIVPGAYRVPLGRLGDERGYITKLWQEAEAPEDDSAPLLREVYLSAVHPGIIKGWHRHKNMTLRFACVSGAVMVGLIYDNLPASVRPLTGRIFISDGAPPYSYCYAGLLIEPGIWVAFRPVEGSGRTAVILNLASHVHADEEIERRYPRDFHPDFDWGDYDKARSS